MVWQPVELVKIVAVGPWSALQPADAGMELDNQELEMLNLQKKLLIQKGEAVKKIAFAVKCRCSNNMPCVSSEVDSLVPVSYTHLTLPTR